MRVKPSSIVYLFAGFVFFYVSYFLISAYTYGDQVSYRAFYEALGNATYNDVMRLARNYVSSGEPLSSYVLWFGAWLGLDKDIYVSLLNTILLFSLTLFLVRNKVNAIIIILLLTNFYVIVLLTGAERLKIAYIMFFLACLARGKARWILVGLSPLAHFQSLIFLPALYLYRYAGEMFSVVYRFKVRQVFFSASLLFTVFFSIFIYLFWENVKEKLDAYINTSFDIFSLFQVSVLALATLILFQRKASALVMFAYLSFVVLLLGGDRVNMIAFSLTVYFLVVEENLTRIKFDHLPFLAVLVYLSYKTIDFVYNIISYGNGFYSG